MIAIIICLVTTTVGGNPLASIPSIHSSSVQTISKPQGVPSSRNFGQSKKTNQPYHSSMLPYMEQFLIILSE